jgi:hypothetical protein
MDYVQRGKMWVDSQTDKILKMLRAKTWMNHPRVKMWIDSQTDRKLKDIKDQTWMNHPGVKLWIESRTDRRLKILRTTHGQFIHGSKCAKIHDWIQN